MQKSIFFVASLIVLALGAMGCESPCEKGLKHQNMIGQHEAYLYQAVMSGPDHPSFGKTCKDFAEWTPKFKEASVFAKKTAQEYLKDKTRKCVKSHVEYRCVALPPFHPVPGERCRPKTVCDQWDSAPNHKAGFAEATRLAALLNEVSNDLSAACAEWSQGRTNATAKYLGSAQVKLSAAYNDGDYVLEVAGCFDKKK